MKVKDLTNAMNDHGTNPRVKILKYKEANGRCYNALVYDGYPGKEDEEVAKMKVLTFTVVGRGRIEIFVQ